MKKNASVLVHIVSWNSAESIEHCIQRASEQEDYRLGDNLMIHITDNASTDITAQIVSERLVEGITFSSNANNLGFSGAHNQGVEILLQSDFDAMLVLNPDVGLSATTIKTMVRYLSMQKRIGIVTPKLLRALPSLEPIYPHVLDACGMELTGACRHFDRGSGAWDNGQFEEGMFVFGATGACMMISRECINEIALPDTLPNEALYAIYPQLRDGATARVPLFDEAFFAYREDADLSWRARTLGWNCWYEPTAIAYHVRVVVPERRKSLSPDLNMYGVRNRFLLQMNNWRLKDGLWMFLWGILIRNIIVIGAVLIQERSSIVGLHQAKSLFRRSMCIRQWITEQVRKKR